MVPLRCQALSPEDFSSPLLGRIYGALLEAWNAGRPLSPAVLEGQLTPDEMGHLTSLLQKPESLAGADRSLPDYIGIIQDAAGKRRGDAQIDPLLAAKDKFKEKKGNVGKQND